ncbi:hypothetical protein QFZ97_006533 [Paraburkholderia youngii]
MLAGAISRSKSGRRILGEYGEAMPRSKSEGELLAIA